MRRNRGLIVGPEDQKRKLTPACRESAFGQIIGSAFPTRRIRPASFDRKDHVYLFSNGSRSLDGDVVVCHPPVYFAWYRSAVVSRESAPKTKDCIHNQS